MVKNMKNGLLFAAAMLLVSGLQAVDTPAASKMSMTSMKKVMTACAKMPGSMLRYAWNGIQSDDPCACTVWADRSFRLLGIAAVAYHGYVVLPKVYAYLRAKVASQDRCCTTC